VGVKVGIDFAQVVAAIRGAIRDDYFGMRCWEVEFHLGKLTARLGEVDGFGFGSGNGGGGCRCEQSFGYSDLSEKLVHGVERRCVVNCRECVMIRECSEIVLIYLVKIVDEVFGVVADGVLVSVLVSEGSWVAAKYAKSVACV